jgi:hypothetical protein
LCVSASLVAHQLCTIIRKLVIGEIVDEFTEFDRTLGGIILTVLPRNIVTYEIERLLPRVVRCSSVVLNRYLLQTDEGLLPCRVGADVPNKIVKLANWTLATPACKLYKLGRNTAFKLVFKCFDIRAKEDLISHKVDDVPYTEDVPLACIEGKLLR